MKKLYLLVLATLLLPVSGVFAQHHLGLGVGVIAPLSPFSDGYKTGYDVSLMYRHFQMTRSLIIDASLSYSHIGSQGDTIQGFDNWGDPVTFYPEPIKSISVRAGIAWAFVPNASPYIQPYAGFDGGISITRSEYGISRQTPMGARLGWMVYVNERFLFGAEAKYNLVLALDERNDSQYTALEGIFDHYLSFQLSAMVKLGKGVEK